MTEIDNPFWTFSLSVYEAPGVADECVALQDAVGLDVNVLLFCAWVGVSTAAVLGAEDFSRIVAKVGDWQKGVVRPLREVRRTLKPQVAKDASVARLRADIARDELYAERLEQASLYAYSRELKPSGLTPEEALRRNVTAYLDWQAAGEKTHCNAARRCDHLIAAALTKIT